MSVATPPSRRSPVAGLVAVAVVALLAAGLAPVFVLGIGAASSSRVACAHAAADPGRRIALGPPGAGETVGATEYGGPGDPSSGTVGSSGVDLDTHPDSYAELGGLTFQTATAMGGLPYGAPLRITWGGRSVIAYKRDIGLGGGPVAGLPRVLDLWWELAGALRIPYEDGAWSGPVRVQRPPATGAGNVLGASVASLTALRTSDGVLPADACGAPPTGSGAAPVTPGPRARLLASGLAAAPDSAPAAVRGIIAAGNELVGRPYQYGGGHGIPLDELAPSYDCSSSVAHLLWGGGLVPVDYDSDAAAFESWGVPGPGRWVTLYASADHVYMYVAGLRWDTHDAAGPDDGTAGIGWHPLVREDGGFVARHPAGL